MNFCERYHPDVNLQEKIVEISSNQGFAQLCHLSAQTDPLFLLLSLVVFLAQTGLTLLLSNVAPADIYWASGDVLKTIQ